MEESKLSSEVPEAKSATEDQNIVDVPVKAVNEETTEEEEVLEKEEEDTTSDGGFIKVEREGIDSKADDEKAELKNSRKRIKELEEGIIVSSIKTQKLKDMEILVQTEKYRIQELEEQMNSLEKKYEQTEVDYKRYLGQVADLQSTLEEFQVKNSSLEAAGLRESEVMNKLKSTEEKLEQQAREIDEATTRNKELEVLKHENELLANTNNQFKIKIQELQELQVHGSFEKETAMKQFEEMTKRFNLKDKEAKELIGKIKSLENQIEEYKREVQETAGVSDIIKAELEKLSALEAEKDKTDKELKASKKTIEDLTKQLTSEGDRLKSIIFSLAEENNEVNKKYHNTKDESQSMIVKLKEQLIAEKSKANALVSEIEKLTAMDAEKSVLESHFEEVRKHVRKVEAQLTEEVNNAVASAAEKALLNEQALQLQKKLQDSQAIIDKRTKTLTQKQSEVEELETRVKELEQKVKLEDAKSKETEVEVKSGDTSLSVSASTQSKKSKNKSKASQSSSSGNNVATQTVETKHQMTVKIVVGVVLVAIIVGVVMYI